MPVRCDVQPCRLVAKIEDDLIRGEAMHNSFLGQNKTLMMGTADKNDLRIRNLNDLLQLAPETVVLLGVVLPQDRKEFAAVKELLKFVSGTTRRLPREPGRPSRTDTCPARSIPSRCR